MKKTFCLMALAGLAALTFSVGCGDSGTGGSGGSASGGGSDGGSSAGGGTEGGGGAGTLVNGCDQATADDETGAATYDITWTLPAQVCARVSVGTVVTWTGDFALHPLKGGSPGSPDTGDISSSDQTGASASVTFDAAGEYPFFCNVHQASMQGVIYVE